jgi:hypothetical protein
MKKMAIWPPQPRELIEGGTSGTNTRVGYLEDMGMLIGPVGGPSLGPPVSSSGTWNLVWNFGRSLLGFQGLMIDANR